MGGFQNPTAQTAFNPAPSPFTQPLLHRALASPQGGVAGDRKILLVGDSQIYGFTGTGTQPLAGIGPAKALAAHLNGLGIPSLVGLAVPRAAGLGNDARWTPGTGWALTGGLAASAWGGEAVGYVAAAGAAGSLVYTPGTLCDRFDVYFLINANQGTVQATATGGGATPCNGTSGGARSIGKVTVSAGAASAANTLTLATVTTNPVQIIGIEPWQSTVPTLRVGNAGAIGATANLWTGSAGIAGNDPRSCITAYAPDISIISLGTNDAFLTFTTAQFVAGLTLLIQTCLATGAVLIVSAVPSQNTTDNRVAGNVGYDAAMPALAASLGVDFLDTFNLWGAGNAYALLNPLGYYTDTFHASQLGNADWGRTMAQALLSY